MLVDIFSSLDGYQEVGFSVTWLVWVMAFSSVMIPLVCFWVSPSRSSVLVYSLFSVVFSLVEQSFGKFMGGFCLGLVGLFLALFGVNLSGMVPDIFSVTSQVSVTFCLSSSLWFSLILSGFSWSWKRSGAQLLPTGTPIALSPLLIVIESVSILVRPITLGVRIAANITMGHLMLGVLGGYTVSFLFSSFSVGVFCSILSVGYILFEFAVSFLQAYVFVLLLTLYSSDHPAER
uniref:ATP synthase subunit a n=1 Tax=Neotrigonia margaritacea TaxID=47539 RepID=A0A1Y9T609_9BIVA|nr:ATP synthase F0 subunit 6 [Neotrigonia margaritacea]AQT38497.1 ATP synthase F0 subunit 6 [Neotrigonia margaritacea]